jgi:hypothetical protein
MAVVMATARTASASTSAMGTFMVMMGSSTRRLRTGMMVWLSGRLRRGVRAGRARCRLINMRRRGDSSLGRSSMAMRPMGRAMMMSMRTVSSAAMGPRTPKFLVLERIELGSRTSVFSGGRSTLVVLQTGDKVPEVAGLVHVSRVRHG